MKTMAPAPCGSCPFRKDKPIYLRQDRRTEIAEALLSGQSFYCHNTVDYDGEPDEWGEETADTTSSLQCAGAEKALMKSGTSSQMGRISERLGLLDLDKIEAQGTDVWDIYEWQTLVEGSTGDDPEFIEIETCSYVGSGCLAPAGFMVGGGVVPGMEEATEHCEMCGEPLCEECVTFNGMCPYCDPDGEEDEEGY